MWALILIMVYISLIIGCRGFGSKDHLCEIICTESYGGVTFDLWPLLQGRMWSLIPIMASPLLLLIKVLDVKTTYRKSSAPNLLVMSDLTLEPSLKVECGP